MTDQDCELLKPITPEEKPRKTNGYQEKKRYTPIVPVPPEGLSFDKATFGFHNQKFGKEPDFIHEYHLADGPLAMLTARWDGVKQKNGAFKKEVRPYIYGTDAKGTSGWYSQWLDNPPLYNLPRLTASNAAKGMRTPLKPILFVEGEKTADAAQILFPDYDVTTTAGGANAAAKTDFSPVKGRYVLVSPDCGEAGGRYGDDVYKHCKKAGARRIQKFDTAALSKLTVKDGEVVEREPDQPIKETYDLADALAEGWTADLMASYRESLIGVYLEQDAETMGEYKLTRTGVYQRRLNEARAEEDWIWICPYLKVTHQVSNLSGQAWGKLVAFYDPKGDLKTQILSNELLAGDGKELREQLARVGFSILPRSYNRNQFNEYIHFSTPQKFTASVQKIGWLQEGIYVLPDKIYGDQGGSHYIQQIKPHHRPHIEIKGELQGWQDQIARYAQGNTRLILAIVTPLVATFLTPLRLDGHIFNLYGNSSIGKSSALAVASSVTGFPMNSFLNTNNALESVFVSHNDACVVIDEMGLARSDKLGDLAYVATNGKTKGRANQKGEGIEAASFKTNGLLSGEKTFGGKIEESGHKATAGQEVRFVDIPADARRGFGIFEGTHGMASQRLADHLRQASSQYKGAAFDALLEHLASLTWEAIAESVNPAIAAFKARHLEALKRVPGQAHRVLAYFALHAAVGEFCIQIGVLPWEAGTVTHAYDILFKEWLGDRGGMPRELMETIDNINRLCQQQISRFDVEEHNAFKAATSHNRAGTIKKIDGATIFCVFPQVFKVEVIGGKDEKAILPELVKMGVLKAGEDGKRTIQTRIDKIPNPVRMYHLTPSILEEETDGQEQDNPPHIPFS